MEYLFVYGTLLRGYQAHKDYLLKLPCSYYTDAFMNGVLFDVGGYPGVIESKEPNDLVYGEVYALSKNFESGFLVLDQYEGCSAADPKHHEYIRKEIFVNTEDAKKLKVWVYVYQNDIFNKRIIASGDFRKI